MEKETIHGSFVWDEEKEAENRQKHRLDFETATLVFADPKRLLYRDQFHSGAEERFFCIGKIAEKVVTVRFTYREETIRIIGAGFWRKGRKIYEKENKEDESR